jgi:hypothetical protein
VVIETTLLARVLRLKLLTLEGTVIVSPARVHDISDGYQNGAASAVKPEVASAPTLNGSAASRQGSQTSRRHLPPIPSADTVGERLSETASRLEETRKVLRALDRT